MLLVSLKALGVRKLGPQVEVALTTISVEMVTKETLAVTMITRSESPLTGCQSCLETGSSLSPSSITPQSPGFVGLEKLTPKRGVGSQEPALSHFLLS